MKYMRGILYNLANYFNRNFCEVNLVAKVKEDLTEGKLSIN